ncbi:MAG: flagellar hook protein FlgE [Proteobacteria bacterium]|nr:flagellar hook protein FlgE [Pseudomonadota bacterium]
MAFTTALSGVNAAQSDLDVISNNIANSSTTGFKTGRAEFGDVYAQSLLGTTTPTPGQGVKVTGITQQFSQGDLEFTDNALDVAINGDGFFQVKENGVVEYTRAGAFKIDKDGYISTVSGARVQGFQVDATTGAVTGNIGDIQTQTALLDPKASTTATITGNLNAGATAPATTPFSATDSTSYNSTTSLAVFDSKGNSHTLDLYFVKTATANQWDVYSYIDGTSTTANATTALITALPFSTAGAYDATGNKGTATIAQDVAGAASLSIALDITGLTQYGTNFAVTTAAQNGYSAGQLSSIEVSEYGLVSARYSNGISSAMGQFALADFQNPNGLQPVGSSNWIETFKSGMPVLNKAGNANLGLIQGFALEQSNVAITQELVDLIVAQRNFQANAQVVQAEDAITQTIINMR